MTDWEAKAEEACARLGITDEKTRALVLKHERTHAKVQAHFALCRLLEEEQDDA